MGGSALVLTSTRSKFSARAVARASSRDTVPSSSPSAPIRRTCSACISSFSAKRSERAPISHAWTRPAAGRTALLQERDTPNAPPQATLSAETGPCSDRSCLPKSGWGCRCGAAPLRARKRRRVGSGGGCAALRAQDLSHVGVLVGVCGQVEAVVAGRPAAGLDWLAGGLLAGWRAQLLSAQQPPMQAPPPPSNAPSTPQPTQSCCLRVRL